MHTKTLVLLTSLFTGFAVASPWNAPTVTKTITVTAPAPTETQVSQCNTGSIQCCNTVQSASSPSAANILGPLGIVVQGVGALVGLGCTPISVIGVDSGAKCGSQPVCCQNNTFQGLINIGCTPITL